MKTGHAAGRRQRDRRASGAGLGVLAAILLLAAGLLWLAAPDGRQGAGVGGPFSLVDDDGRVVTEHSFPGKYLAIYFGYTACQDVCPATMANLAAALARLGSQGAQVQPLFITVDPARDTPEVLRRFVANFKPSLRGLTGSPGELGRVDREYHVVSRRDGATVDHSSVIYLLAPDGKFVAPIPADASEMVIAEAISRQVAAPS